MSLTRILSFGLILCILTACIDVDDFGGMWEKASLDPALEGRWKKISEEDDNHPSGHEWTFTVKNGAYEIQSYVKGKKDEDGPLYPVKSIVVGRYHFLASGPERGMILRYEIEGNKSAFFVLKSDKAWAFIQKNYPNEENIYREDADDDEDALKPKAPHRAEGRGEGAEDEADDDDNKQPVKIRVFDDEVAKILAAIPDNETYWDPDTELEKVK